MNTVTAAILVPLLPLAAAGLLRYTGRRAPEFVRPLAVLPALAAAALAGLVAAQQGGGEPVEAATGLNPTDNPALAINLALHLDGFAVLMAVLVTVVAAVVQLYCTSYLRDDPRYPVYAALVSLCTAAMLLVIYTDDLIMLLVGWEVLGLSAYFLVRQYRKRPAARAAHKALLITKLGDLPFLIGILVLASETGTFRISHIVSGISSSLSAMELSHPTAVGLLLLAGVIGSAALTPLLTRLEDATAGPTPVSVLIHAVTMAAAGAYVIGRLLPVFAASATVLLTLAVLAALTMIGTALAALAQDHLPRVLVYSTIGQLGLVAGALAVGSRDAAVFHLLTHGAFHALLFLAAGVLIAAAGTGSLRLLSKLAGLKQRVPDAYWTFTIGLLALAAVPPFAGFFSTESVLAAAEHTATDAAFPAPSAAGWTVLISTLITAGLTAAYALRIWLMAFHDPVRLRTEALPERRAPGTVTTVALWALAVPSLVLGLAHRPLPDWFNGTSLDPQLVTAVLSLTAVALGALATYAAWRRRYEMDEVPDPSPPLLGSRLQ